VGIEDHEVWSPHSNLSLDQSIDVGGAILEKLVRMARFTL
jgi:hypothetical protein